MGEEEPRLVRFLVGSGSIEELARKLEAEEAAEAEQPYVTPAEDDEVEFVQPKRPGRVTPPLSPKPSEDD